MNYLIKFPEYVPDTRSSRSLALANIYIGVANQDPETSPISVYALEQGGTEVEISQPVSTNAGGYVIYDGNPITLFVKEASYSLKLKDSLGTQIDYRPYNINEKAGFTLDKDDYLKGTKQDDSVVNLLGLNSSDEIEIGEETIDELFSHLDRLPIGKIEIPFIAEQDVYFANNPNLWQNLTASTPYDKTLNPEFAAWFAAWGIVGNTLTMPASLNRALKFGVAAGVLEADAIQEHEHTQQANATSSFCVAGGSGPEGRYVAYNTPTTGMVAGIHGVPRTGPKTLMENISFKVYVKIA